MNEDISRVITPEEQKFIDGMVLKYPVGSKLYGTDTPESDTDFCGVFVAPEEYYTGMLKVEEVDFSKKSKQENGRNDKNAIDFKIYEIRKFVRLAMENNPNVVEQMFVPPNKISASKASGDYLLAHAFLFPYKGCHTKFSAYATSQEKKMIVKRDNMFSMIEIDRFLEGADEGYLKKFVADAQSDFKNLLNAYKLPFEANDQHIYLGDICIQRNITVRRAHRQIKERMSKFSGRFEDYVSKYGYDTKFASHLIRLLCEDAELLSTGILEFPMKERKLILDVKLGKFTINEVMELAHELRAKNDNLYLKTDLPTNPRFDEIQRVLMTAVDMFRFDEPDINCKDPYIMKKIFNRVRVYNPNYGDDRVCKCGHPYYRHFDTYDDMYPCGCKYCGCFNFEEKE